MLGPMPCRSTYKLINNTIFYPGMNTAFWYNAVFIPGLFFIFSFHPDRRIPRGKTISLILSWYIFRNPNLLLSPFPTPWNKSYHRYNFLKFLFNFFLQSLSFSFFHPQSISNSLPFHPHLPSFLFQIARNHISINQ